MNGTIENEQKYETDSYAREKRIWPDGPKEELHHISDRELCETLTDTNCRKFKRTYNQNEGATILDLSSSFFSLIPSRTVISTDNLAGTLSAEHYPINYYRVTYGVVGISLSREKGRKDGKKGRKREKKWKNENERKKKKKKEQSKGNVWFKTIVFFSSATSLNDRAVKWCRYWNWKG